MKKSFLHLVLMVLLIITFGVSPARAQNEKVRIKADANPKSGEPGSTVTFNLTIEAIEAGTYTLTTKNNANWTVNIPNNTGQLEKDATVSKQVEVVIPPNAADGDSANVDVIATSGDQEVAMVTLTVNVNVVQPPTPTPSPAPSSSRPIVVIESYYLDEDTVRPGEDFGLFLSLKNKGGTDAHNLIFTFSGEDFIPKETGGVVAKSLLKANESNDIAQRLLASDSLWGKTAGSVSIKVTYNNPAGEVFTESFALSLPILGWSNNWATATLTPTATALPLAQLVVNNYKTDVDPLQPGSIFTLDLDVQNLGSGDAKDVTVVLGGGALPTVSETPAPGGVSGGGADLTTFAPLGSSNLQFLDDIAVGASAHTTQKLIVNVSANPGAYPLKLSFVYTDSKGNRQVDDQIITMLIYQMPQVEINYYRDPGPISAMQPNTLPIQVVNLGRKVSVLGNMTVSAEGADLMNNVSLVGTLDAGGYFPLDVMLIPHNPGPLDVKINISYTDDFNQPRSISHTMKIDVVEGAPVGPGMEGPVAPGMEPGTEGMPGMKPGEGLEGVSSDMPQVEENFWQKALRFLKGLVGLDSAVPQPEGPMGPVEMPQGEELPQPVPVRPGGKG